MGKTTKPLKILVVGPSAGQLFQDKKIQALIAKGDNVQVLEVEADMIIGETAYRTFPKTVKFTIAALDQMRKAKPKQVKDAIGKKGKKSSGKKGAGKTKKAATSEGQTTGILPEEES